MSTKESEINKEISSKYSKFKLWQYKPISTKNLDDIYNLIINGDFSDNNSDEYYYFLGVYYEMKNGKNLGVKGTIHVLLLQDLD